MSGYTSTSGETRRGLFLIVLAAISWGTVGVTTRILYGISDANPSSVGFFRLGLATPILLLGCWGLFGRKAFDIARRDLIIMALMGVMLAVYQVCFFAALTYVGVAVATLVTLCTA